MQTSLRRVRYDRMTDYLAKIMESTETSLPTLDEVVLASLSFFSQTPVPWLNVHAYQHPLVVGSVNALSTGRIIFSGTNALFADEGTYDAVLARTEGVDAIYVISASGAKHAVQIAQKLKDSSIPVHLITSDPEAPARAHIPEERIFVFPHIREPYTYNVSTYMGMMLGASGEDPAEIRSFLEREVIPAIPAGLNGYTSFVFTVPPEYGDYRDMIRTKFDELFAPICTGRAFTSEEIKHAKIVIPSETQAFFHIGTPTTPYAKDEHQFSVPVPASCGPAAMLAIAYCVVGHIQKQHPPYFAENIASYVETASRVFGQPMQVIVE